MLVPVVQAASATLHACPLPSDPRSNTQVPNTQMCPEHTPRSGTTPRTMKRSLPKLILCFNNQQSRLLRLCFQKAICLQTNLHLFKKPKSTKKKKNPQKTKIQNPQYCIIFPKRQEQKNTLSLGNEVIDMFIRKLFLFLVGFMSRALSILTSKLMV